MSSSLLQVLQVMAALTLTPLNGPVNDHAPVPAAKPSTPPFWQPQLRQWRQILEQEDKSAALYKTCASAPAQCPSEDVARWQMFLAQQMHQPRMQQLIAVNDFLNASPYEQDSWLYGVSDHWVGVQDFLKRSGDCEDFAIAKYFSLRQLGFPADDMQIMLVYDVYSGTDHALLRVALDDNIYFLDNREDVIDTAGFEKRYRPHLAFNEADVHLYDQPLMARSIRADDTRILPGNR